MRNQRLSATILVVACVVGQQVHGSTGTVIVHAIGRFLFNQTGRQASEQAVRKLTKEVGEELIERTAAKIVREGGEESLQRVGRMVASHGPEVVRALDNVPNPIPVVRMMDELPVGEIGAAAVRLSAGSAGKELAQLSGKLGTSILRAEAKHPGIGLAFSRALGKEGAELSLSLTGDQAIQFGRHVNDIAQLPGGQQSALIGLISQNVDRFTSFVGRFVEKNPGKVLFTAAGTTLILAQPERFLGGDEIVFDAEGNPVVVTKPGIVGRAGNAVSNVISSPIRLTLNLIGIALVGAVSIFLGIKIRESLPNKRESIQERSKDHNLT